MQKKDKRVVFLQICTFYYTPDASALAVPHNSMATKSFGVRFDLLANLLPPGIASLWFICKTQNSESYSFHKKKNQIIWIIYKNLTEHWSLTSYESALN